MSTDAPTELEDFQRFLAEQLESGKTGLSLDECLAEFRARQAELAQLKQAIRPAIERFHRGEGREIDFEQLKQDVTDRLAREGIRD